MHAGVLVCRLSRWVIEVVPNLNSYVKMGYDNQLLQCCLHESWKLNVCNKLGIFLPHLTFCMVTLNVQNHFQFWLPNKSLQKRLVPACQWKALSKQGHNFYGQGDRSCCSPTALPGDSVRDALHSGVPVPRQELVLFCVHHLPSQWWMYFCCDKHGRCRKRVIVSNVCTALTFSLVYGWWAMIRRKRLSSVMFSVASYQESRLIKL